MTEAEWLACAEPKALLEHLKALGCGRTRTGKRKLRLFGCACCRRIWDQLDDASRGAVAASEQFADGLLSKKELDKVETETLHRGWGAAPDTQHACALWACHNAVRQGAPTKRAEAVVHLVGSFVAGGDGKWIRQVARAGFATPIMAALSALLRDIFGNPFRAVKRDPLWLAWNDGAIGKMAQLIYDGRAFDRLPLLADALEDAGCTDAAVLSHCRGGGEHVRGCWVLDLLLGKE